MKHAMYALLVISLWVMTSAIATERLLSEGIAGVPWSGSRDEFTRRIPSLTCAPLGCRGPWRYHGIDGKLDLTWGGLSPVITSSTFKFSHSGLPEMKRLLRRDLGAPKRQYKEEGETVTEWSANGTLIDLYHGSGRNGPQLYIEPKRKK